MAREYRNAESLTPPPGGIYTHAVRVGSMVFIAGQLARDKDGNVVGDDAEAQYAQVWRNVVAALESVGAGPQHLVKTVTHVVGAENLALVRRAREALKANNPPASTMVVVAGLADPRFFVEVDGIAVVED